MKKSLVLYFLAITICLPGSLLSQTMLLNTPNASPKAAVEQMVGLTLVRIDYHRPAVQDRDIWGDLVPYGTPWRAGANENTVISFSTDVRINGENLKAGNYGLHIIPEENTATLIFSNNSGSWGSYTYQKEEDALRVSIKTESTDAFQEHLGFQFSQEEIGSAACALVWADRKFPFTIDTDLHEVVLAGIRTDLRNKAGWTWQGWHEAANYCLANDVNVGEGLAWATRSVFMSPNSNNMILKARLSAKAQKLEGDAATSHQLEVLEQDLNSMSVSWKEYHGASNFAKAQKQNDKALEWINTSIEMHPTMTNMMALRDLYEAKGETKKAKKAAEEAIAMGSNAELNIYGYTLMWSGKTAEAVKIMEANAEKHPEDPNVWDSLGEIYIANGQPEKAAKALKKSLSLDPPANVKANSERLLQQIGVDPTDINP
ncbi:MAG: DUF2911 domain-containing protein [Bacteroidetes bacterium]|nr:DUF2911 domain-containing protein [Bacteroidota bacterium]